MGKKRYLLLVALTVISGFMGGFLASQIFMEKSAVAQETNPFSATMSPGKLPYIPTRMEWLQLYLNVHYSYDFSEYHFGLSFVNPGDKPETVLIWCSYMPEAQPVLVYKAVANSKEWVKKVAKSYGWDDWVKIEEKVEMAETRSQSR